MDFNTVERPELLIFHIFYLHPLPFLSPGEVLIEDRPDFPDRGALPRIEKVARTAAV
jgi:hypothetical protein